MQPSSGFRPSEFRLVLITVPSEADARALATGLVEEQLAACVNLIPGLTSIYRWKGEVQTEPEALLLVKTTQEALPVVEQWVLDNHPYDVPEFVVLGMDGVNAAYGSWLREQVRAF